MERPFVELELWHISSAFKLLIAVLGLKLQLNARFFYFVQCSTLKALKGAWDKESNPLVNQGQNSKSKYQMRGNRSRLVAMETKLHEI